MQSLMMTVGKGALAGSLVGALGAGMYRYRYNMKKDSKRDDIDTSSAGDPTENDKSASHSGKKEKGKDKAGDRDQHEKERETKKSNADTKVKDETSPEKTEEYAFLNDSSILDTLKNIEPYMSICSSKRYKEFLRHVSRVVEAYQLSQKSKDDKDGNENTVTLSPTLVFDVSKSLQNAKQFFDYVRECYKDKKQLLAPQFEEEEKQLIESLESYLHAINMELQYRARFTDAKV